jgi:hypothetical protein
MPALLQRRAQVRLPENCGDQPNPIAKIATPARLEEIRFFHHEDAKNTTKETPELDFFVVILRAFVVMVVLRGH